MNGDYSAQVLQNLPLGRPCLFVWKIPEVILSFFKNCLILRENNAKRKKYVIMSVADYISTEVRMSIYN